MERIRPREGRVIAVTGLPGSLSPNAVKVLVDEGFAVGWPQQDIRIAGGEKALSQGENPELIRIHEMILGRAGQNWFTWEAPRFYDKPFPGPEEYLRQFGLGDIVLSDPRLSLFFPLWDGFVDHAIVCEVEPEYSARQMHHWLKGEAALDLCLQVAQHYQIRQQEHITRAARTVLTDQQLRDGSHREIIQGILKSTF